MTGRTGDDNMTTELSADLVDRAELERLVEERTRELRESEERYRSLFDHAPVCVHEIDLEGNLLSMNRAGREMMGLTEQESVLGKSYIQFLGVPDRSRVSRLLSRACSGQGSRFEFVGTEEMGSHIFRSGFLPIHSSDGRVVRVMGLTEDITERRRTEEQVLRFGRALEHSLNEIYIFESETLRFVTVNQGARDNLGFTTEELLKMTPLDIKPDFSAESFSRLIAPLRTGRERVLVFTTRHLRKDGSSYPVEIHLQLIQKGTPAFIGMAIDITERLKAEREWTRLATVMEQAAVLVIITDLDGGIVYANARAETATGYSRSELIGQNPRILGSGEHDEAFFSDMWKTIGGGDTWTGIIRNRRKDGTHYHVESTISPIRTSEGAIFNYAAVQNDVTDRVLLSEDRERLLETIREQARIEKAAQQHIRQQERLAAVGQLAAGIAHDFNNIMGIINLYTMLLKKAPELSSESVSRLNTILQQAGHATSLTQQILDFGRRNVLERQPTDLNTFLQDVVVLLGHTIPENISVELHCDSSPHIVSGDQTRLQQVLMNLAVNARDAMPDGGLLRFDLDELSVSGGSDLPLPEMLPGAWVRIVVTDTGQGIPEDRLDRIFEPFFTTKRPGSGTGLGLAQVFGILKQHDGHISVESEEGQGTTISLYLPSLAMGQPVASGEDSQDLVQGTGGTVLVVEDNETFGQALCETLELMGYQTLSANGGLEALNILETTATRVSLVLSDLVMPGMGGQSLFRELRRRDMRMPVVFLTGHLMEDELKELRLEGLAGWMLKPPDPARLSAMLSRILNGGSSGEGLG
jgi:PAS domain S-box-containing protein